MACCGETDPYVGIYHHGITVEEFEALKQETDNLVKNDPHYSILDENGKRELLKIKIYQKKHEKKYDGDIKKMLLLGTGHSGKSTIFKSLRDIHEKYEESDFIESRHVIRQNLVAGMLTLLKKSQILYELDSDKYANCLLEMTDDIVEAIQLIVNHGSESFTEALDYTEVEKLGIYLIHILDYFMYPLF